MNDRQAELDAFTNKGKHLIAELKKIPNCDARMIKTEMDSTVDKWLDVSGIFEIKFGQLNVPIKYKLKQKLLVRNRIQVVLDLQSFHLATIPNDNGTEESDLSLVLAFATVTTSPWSCDQNWVLGNQHAFTTVAVSWGIM